MFGTEGALLNVQGASEKSLRARIEAETKVDVAHGVHEAGLQFGILRQTRLNVASGFVEDFAGGYAAAERFAGIGNLEHASHEIRDAIGAIAFAGGAAELQGLKNGEGDKQSEESGGHRDGNVMAANVFATR